MKILRILGLIALIVAVVAGLAENILLLIGGAFLAGCFFAGAIKIWMRQRAEKRNMTRSYSQPQNIPPQNSERPYPAHFANAMAKLSDPDMRFVSDFGFRVLNDYNYARVDLVKTREFINKFVHLFWNTDFAENFMCEVAISSYVMVFLTKPDLFFKETGIVNVDDFVRILDVELNVKSTQRGTDEIDYKLRRESEREYLETMEEYPAMEATHSNIPVEQTNWYKMVQILRDRVED